MIQRISNEFKNPEKDEKKESLKKRNFFPIFDFGSFLF